MRKLILFTILLFLTFGKIYAQGTFSGDLMMNLNFFQRDSSIRASGNPLYDKYLSGSEGWLDLRYNYKGFTVFARVDAFNNSNLKNPTQANTAFGLGAWSVSKEIKDLTITAGYIYDQIGSGILFRSYEDRGLLIDNALVGFELKYKLNDHIILKGLSGQQKDNDLSSSYSNSQTTNNSLTLSQRYNPIIRAFNAEGDFDIGKAHLVPGIGVLNRTLDQQSMDAVISTITNYKDANAQFEPKYNMYAFTAYNTLTVGNFSWYAEGAYKTHEAIVNPYALADEPSLVDKDGNVEYTTLSYARKGLAVNLSGKRTEHFVMRTSPLQTLTNGMLNWQPVVARLRPGRLMSRYTPASQDYSETAGTADVLISPSDYLNFTLTYTHINTLDNMELYREGYAEAYYQSKGKWILQGGVQYLEYNKLIYQSDSKAQQQPIVYALTPFAEATYRIDEKRSIRTEWEYMATKQDYGSWIYGLVEFDVAPKWSISLADMYNVTPNNGQDNPNYDPATGKAGKSNHYYNVYVAYTKGPHRFAIAYVKQVDGINCAGGVCRYEPAFSGVKATITSSF